MPSIQFNSPSGPGADTSRATEIHTSGKNLATDAPCVDGRNAEADVVAQVPAVCMRRLLALHTAAHRGRGEVPHAGN